MFLWYQRERGSQMLYSDVIKMVLQGQKDAEEDARNGRYRDLPVPAFGAMAAYVHGYQSVMRIKKEEERRKQENGQ